MRIDWNVDAFKDIRYGRHDASIIGMCETEAQKLADKASSMGPGTYATGSRAGAARPQGRHRASVVTADHAAIRDNAKNNTLLRALGSSS